LATRNKAADTPQAVEERDAFQRLQFDIASAEAITRRDESRLQLLRGRAARSEDAAKAFGPRIKQVEEEFKKSSEALAALTGEEAPIDRAGTSAGLSDEAGNFAKNADVAAAGGIGVAASNTDVPAGKPAETGAEAGVDLKTGETGVGDVQRDASAVSEIEITDNWKELSWADKRSLASKFSELPIRDSKGADAAIEAEVKRRAASKKDEKKEA
jgi:hypothetical protein